jgi:hypothetical protein
MQYTERCEIFISVNQIGNFLGEALLENGTFLKRLVLQKNPGLQYSIEFLKIIPKLPKELWESVNMSRINSFFNNWVLIVIVVSKKMAVSHVTVAMAANSLIRIQIR